MFWLCIFLIRKKPAHEKERLLHKNLTCKVISRGAYLTCFERRLEIFPPEEVARQRKEELQTQEGGARFDLCKM